MFFKKLSLKKIEVMRILLILTIPFCYLQTSQCENFNYKPKDYAFYEPKSDTINENIVVEYDTIQLPSDTIRITDTLLMINNTTKETNPEMIVQKNNPDYSLSMCFSPFITSQYIVPKKSEDSTKYPQIQPLNFYYEINFGLKINKWVYYSGIHFLRFSEIAVKEQYLTKIDSVESDTSFVYVSTLIHTKRQIKNYFYYAGFSLAIGYEMGKNNFIFTPRVEITLSRKLPSKLYKFGQGSVIRNIPSNEQINYLFSLSITPDIAYRINKNILLLISPSYVYNFYGKNIYPVTMRNNFKLGFGIRYEL
jgi:hypothetical protein